MKINEGNWMRVHVLHLRILPMILSAALPWLTGCQPGGSGPRSVSLEEAKQITAEFKGSTFVPPPRKINDIMKLLDEKKLTNWNMVMEARAKAEELPPTTTDPRTLAEFYYERGRNAHFVSRLKQAVSDYSRALEIMRRVGINERGRDSLNQTQVLRLIASASTGSLKNGIKLLEEAVDVIPDRTRGRRVAAHSHLGSFLMYAGDLEGAEYHLAEAKNYLGRSRPHVEALVLRGEGKLLTIKGELQAAERIFLQALETIREYMTSGVDLSSKGWLRTLGFTLVKIEAFTRASLARNLKLQGRLTEAESEQRKAVELFVKRLGRYSRYTARELIGLADILVEEGRHEEAEMLSQAAIEIYDRIGAPRDSFYRAWARQMLADSLVVRREWAKALSEFETIQKDLASDPEVFKRVFVGFNYALALLKTAQANEALTKIQPLYELKVKLLNKEHYDVAELAGMLGMTYAARGQKEEALNMFGEALPVLLSRSRIPDTEAITRTARGQRLREILESYIALLSDISGTPVEQKAGINGTAEAFRLADVARSQSVQRALTALGARAAARDPSLADLVRREQDTQKQISALYGALASAATEIQDPKVIQSLQSRIEPLKAAHAALSEEIKKRFPDYSALIDPQPVTLDQVKTYLRPGEALISTYVSANKTYVWAVPHRGKAAFAQVPMSREQITAAVAGVRRALSPNARTLGDIPDFDLAMAHKLYQALLEPVRAGWSDARDLLIAPHGPLGQLPFSVLVTEPTELRRESGVLFARYKEVPWLERTHTVTVWPSVTSLVTLRALPPGNPGRRAFVGFGDPWFNERQASEEPAKRTVVASGKLIAGRGLPIRLRSLADMEKLDSALLAQLPRLPDTAEEVRSMALAMNADLTKDVFLGARANEQVVKTMDLSGRRVIAFATHGLVPGDLNGLTQPALALSSPKVARVKGDGLLTMGEILGLKLDADWVVLSACNTGAGQGAGAEAVSGLGRAFFYAGTRAILVSNWPVETTSAKALTTDLFWRQAQDLTLSRAEALRQAMIALIDGPGHVDEQGRTVFSYAHPIFWAPFSLVGDGGSGAAPAA